MSTFHLVFSAIVVIGLILLIRFFGQKGHRCRWCKKPTVKITEVPDPEQSRLTELVQQEQMGSTDLSTYDYCTGCKRIFDWRWFDDDRPFRRDWEMYDRQCHCGCDLRRPSSENLGSDQLRRAMAQMRTEAKQYILDTYGDQDVPALMNDLRAEDHIFFVCPRCLRIYMWLPLEGFQVFQCVTEGFTPYDEGPSGTEHM